MASTEILAQPESGKLEQAKRKKVNYRVLTATELASVRAMVHDLVHRFHPRLAHARFAFLFKLNWSGNVDGLTPLAQVSVVGEQYWRLLEAAEGEDANPPDFILTLNGQAWERLDETQQCYVIDNELCRCMPSNGKDGEQAEDDTGRYIWQLISPDFSGFAEPVSRWGATVLRSVHRFASVVGGAKGAQQSLFEAPTQTM